MGNGGIGYRDDYVSDLKGLSWASACQDAREPTFLGLLIMISYGSLSRYVVYLGGEGLRQTLTPPP